MQLHFLIDSAVKNIQTKEMRNTIPNSWINFLKRVDDKSSEIIKTFQNPKNIQL